MTIDDIKQKIEALDADLVKDFLFNLYQQYPELNTQIETLVLRNDPAALSTAISKRIASISRGRKFIDYQMNFAFASDLDSIVADIEDGLLESSPKHAFDLISKFLATANKVFDRADDSSGDIGCVYWQAVSVWLVAANEWKCSTSAGAKINWLERVYTLYLDNDYAVYDSLLPKSAILLSHDELTKLAWRYESELRQALKNPQQEGGFNMKSLSSGVALGSVAEALKNPEMYERATLIQSPEPNDLQKISIIKTYLQFNHTEGALRWLNMQWESRFETDRLSLLDEAYVQSDNTDALQQTRREAYQRDKSYSSLMRYFERLTESEKQKARLEAIQLAEEWGGSADGLATNVDMLLCLNEADRAESLVLANPQAIDSVFYADLLELAKQFVKQKCWLAATACYRGLLCDILNQARNKAYPYAARYYKKLEFISGQVQKYEPLVDHTDFIKQLEEKHGKKRSFWQRVL